MADDLVAVPLAPVEPAEQPGPFEPPPVPVAADYSDRKKRVRKKLVKARAKLVQVVGSIRRRDAYKACLLSMKEVARFKLSGEDKKQLVIDHFLTAAETGFREHFASNDAIIAFVAQLVEEIYGALRDTKAFKRGGWFC